MKNNDLFELVTSLTKTERRYIRLQAEKNGGSGIYMNLLHEIEKNPGIDEAEFKKLNKEKNFMKHYSFNKFYLYKLIIKCLENYNSEKIIDSKIHTLIMQCKILFDKALYRQYFNSIDKAKKLALKYERYGYYLQILDMEKIIVKKEELMGSKAEMLNKEAIDALESMTNMFSLSLLASNLLSNYRKHGIKRHEQHEEIIQKALESPLMHSDPANMNSRAKESYFRVHEIINEIRGNYPEMFIAQQQRHKVLEAAPNAFKDYIINYEHDILSSMIDSALKLENTVEAEKYILLYKKAVREDSSEYADFEIISTLGKLRICLLKKDLAEAALIIPLLENVLVKYHNKMLIDTELMIRYYIVKYHILAKDFNKALKSLNSLMSHPLIDKRADYESYLKILNLIVHFELKNYSLLKHLIISTYRFLYKRQKLFLLEQLVLDFIRKLPDIKNEDDLIFSFIKFKQKLEKLKQHSYEKNAFEYFDFLKWINEKLT